MKQIKTEIIDGEKVETWEVRGGLGFFEDVSVLLGQHETRKAPTAAQQITAPDPVQRR